MLERTEREEIEARIVKESYRKISMLRFVVFVTALLGVPLIVFHYQLSLHAREREKKARGIIM